MNDETPEISVIICSHNPRRVYLERVLAALKAQTLPQTRWELLLVDNVSDKPLKEAWPLDWHAHAQHLWEPELGLSMARRRGIGGARGSILIFVDDDNVLDATYLTEALAISQSWPMLGVWGGTVSPEFESPPPEWTRPYWGLLAIREPRGDRWSNVLNYDAVPCGAGMCVRQTLAREYCARHLNDPFRRMLGRRGSNLASCEDYDLAFAAVEGGLGTGQFVALQLKHLIAPHRLTREYLLRLRENISYSEYLLWWLRGIPPARASRLRKLMTWARSSGVEGVMRRAEWRGQDAARRFLRNERRPDS